MDVRIERVAHRLRQPLVTSFGEIAVRELLELHLVDEDGATGTGECAPLEAYDGIPIAACEAALRAYAPILRAAGASRPGHLILDECRAVADLPQALAAVDLALWDRAARRAGRPLADLLVDDRLDAVPVNATIGTLDAAGASAAAAEAVGAGFACIKLKVGTGDDARRVAAVRAVIGPHAGLRLDANGAWDVETAVRSIEALAPSGLELVEEPVHGIVELHAVRERVAVRIAMDETIAEPGAVASAATDAACLKVGRAGGITGLLAQASLVRALGGEAYLASTIDGPRGIAAALHCAAALKVELPCGLATLTLFEDPDLAALLPVVDGTIAIPDAPGLL